MKKRTVVLGAILLLLAVVTYLVLQQPGEQSSSGEGGRQLVHFDSSAIDKIELRSPAETVVLEKTSGMWMLTSPLRYRADSAVVIALLNQGNHVILKNVVSSNPAKQSLFQVDSTGVFVQLSAQGTYMAAFHVGKPSSTFSETFVRNEASPDVFLAEGYLEGTFKRKANDFRDKTIFRMDGGSITNVVYHYGDTTFSLALQDTVWRVGNDKANDGVVRTLLSALANIQADDFLDSTLVPGKPTTTIDLSGSQLRFYRDTVKDRYLVQTSGSQQWFTCSEWRARALLKRKKDFLPPG